MRVPLLLLVLLVGPTAASQDAKAEVAAFQKELVTALRGGDRAALERLLADEFTFVHSTGGLDTKTVYIDNLVTSAQQGRPTDVERLDEHVEIYEGHTAVVRSRSVVRRGGEEIPLRGLHVYVRRGERWLWVAGQSTRLPVRPKASAVLTPALRKEYAGRYEVSGGRVLTIREDGETLRAQLPGFREAELIPRTESELAWFNPELNVEAQLVFVRDGEGRVTHAVYRRDGRDVWRAARVRVKP